MERYVAHCGLLCSNCPAYIATMADDREALQSVAERWRVEYGNPGITVGGVTCDGCRATTGRLCFHCSECDTRACVLGRGIETCAQCTDHPCEQAERFFQMVPSARAVLDGLRAR